MECNRDEANRAKEIAEKKFTAKDVVGAKKFAMKAMSLYPGLEGIQQMVSTLDVYISAENKVNGEADWYGLLGVDPAADEETVRKQYRKLALMLHPDKNKSVGADGAFKLISECWSLLSDKARRLAYDQKRNPKVFPQKFPSASRARSAPPGSNGFHNFSKSTSPHVKAQKSNNTSKGSSSHAPPSSHKQKSSTFWTVCHRCKMQYEYLRVYLNHNLLCPNCHEPFFAIETAAPPSRSKVSNHGNHPQQRQSSNQNGGRTGTSAAGRNNSGSSNIGADQYRGNNSRNQANFQWVPFARTAGASSSAQAASMVQQAYEKVKREREEAQAATKRKTHASRKMAGGSLSGPANAVKRRKLNESSGVVNQTNTQPAAAAKTTFSGVRQGSSESSRANGASNGKHSRVQDLSHVEYKNLFMKKARSAIHKKLNEWQAASVSKSTEKGDEKMSQQADEVKEKEHAMLIGVGPCQSKTCKPVDEKREVTGNSGLNLYTKPLGEISIDVLDPDFHDFDKDRTEKCFGENQVWAAYDDDDAMPRYYAMIHSVISLYPFKVRLSWLNSKPNIQLGQMNWVGSGFTKTCGDFGLGKHEINGSLNSFSHKVRWTKRAGGAIHIFPRKGDVWALYRNWSPEWNELTADEVIHEYDMVEVLEDYDENMGVAVTPLVKVAGFKTVFHRHLDPRKVSRIPKEEMFRFSHPVPSHLLTGQEGPNAPKGCQELDPAAAPLELLQVIMAKKEEDDMEVEEPKVVKPVEGNGKDNIEEMEMNSCTSTEEIREMSPSSKENNNAGE